MLKNNYNENGKNSRVMNDFIILCSEESLLDNSENKMKKGYEYMAKINLEYSELGNEYLLNDIDEYEARLAECD